MKGDEGAMKGDERAMKGGVAPLLTTDFSFIPVDQRSKVIRVMLLCFRCNGSVIMTIYHNLEFFTLHGDTCYRLSSNLLHMVKAPDSAPPSAGTTESWSQSRLKPNLKQTELGGIIRVISVNINITFWNPFLLHTGWWWGGCRLVRPQRTPWMPCTS